MSFEKGESATGFGSQTEISPTKSDIRTQKGGQYSFNVEESKGSDNRQGDSTRKSENSDG